jgi:hypothetical protein
MPINLTVELYGNSRIIAGQKLVQLEFTESKVGAVDVIRALALIFPALITGVQNFTAKSRKY